MVANTDRKTRCRLPGSRRPPEPLTAEEKEEYRAIPSDTSYIHHESFDLPSAGEPLPSESDPLPDMPAWRYCYDAGEHVPPARATVSTLSRGTERKLFLRYNHARYRLAKLQAVAPADRTTDHVRAMLAWHRHARETWAVIIRANLPLVLAMIRRFGARSVDVPELVSEGNLVLLRCVEKFDAGRGFKFSTYACRAILKGFSRLADKAGRHRRRFPVEFDPDLERTDPAECRREARRTSRIEALRDVLTGNQAGLRDAERAVVLQRFGIASAGERKTLAQVAANMGICPERVRQIQQRALRKLRLALEGEPMLV